MTRPVYERCPRHDCQREEACKQVFCLAYQDISTAPKDGTRILGWLPHRSEWVIMYRHDPGGRYETWVVEFQGYTGLSPSHWLPLPDDVPGQD